MKNWHILTIEAALLIGIILGCLGVLMDERPQIHLRIDGSVAEPNSYLPDKPLIDCAIIWDRSLTADEIGKVYVTYRRCPHVGQVVKVTDPDLDGWFQYGEVIMADGEYAVVKSSKYSESVMSIEDYEWTLLEKTTKGIR